MLTCGTRPAAAVSALDPLGVVLALPSAGTSPQAGEWLHQDPLPSLGPWGLRFAARQAQRCQNHLQAGREQGCGCRAPVGTALTPAHAEPGAVPGTAWTAVPAQGRTAGAVAPLPQSSVGVLPQGRECPEAVPGLCFPRSTRASDFLRALWGPLCHCLCPGGLAGAPVCSANGVSRLAPRCSTACANRSPCHVPRSESGTRTAGGARDRQLREVSVAGRVGVNAAGFDFPGVYLPHRGGDFLPERKPCLAHALPDAIAPRYARPKVGHSSPAGARCCPQGSPAPLEAPPGAASGAHADTPSTARPGG